MKQLLITVLGPTASGKTSFAAKIASVISGEIISADSRQIYRNMNIGTGKDYDDYIVGGKKVPYHLIDIKDAGEQYSVFEFQKDFIAAWNDITERSMRPVLCGGSGMYLESVLGGYTLVKVPLNNELRDELATKNDCELESILSSMVKLHNVSDVSSRKRCIRAIEIAHYKRIYGEPEVDFPVFKTVIFGLGSDREIRRRKISARLENRITEGLVEEVKALIDSGIKPDSLIWYGLEYKFVTLYLTGEIDYETMRVSLNSAIHQFAKRQMTWFRRMERNGYQIIWLDSIETEQERLNQALKIISGLSE